MKRVILYGAVLIGVYLGVYYYTGAGTLITDSTTGATSVVQALQGR